MVVSDTCSSATEPTLGDQSDIRHLFRLIADNFGKEELGSLVRDQEFKQYTTMTDDGSPISVIHSLPPSSFDIQGFAQFFNSGHTRAASDGAQYAPQQPPHPHPPHATSLPAYQHQQQHRGHQQQHNASNIPRTQPDHWPTMAPPPPASKPKATGFTCNFCLEEGLALACTRKNDLKRHIEDFHHTNSQWLCPIPDCGMAFDWESAFKVHTKSQHEALRIKPPPCKVALCEQVVFACGFETCMQVFEASSDGGGPAKFKDYLAHVIKHYDEGLTSGQWSYTRRMRNLLGQSAMRGAWPRIEREGPYHMIQWDPQNSNILRKKLETRHIDDIQSIVDSAIALGWLPDSPCEAQPALRRPLREGCTMPIIGHAHAASSAVPLPPLHALPLPMSPPVQYTNTAQAPPMPQYFHHPDAAAPAAYMSPNAPPQQAAVVYSPQSSPMYMGHPTPVAEAGYSPLPADYHGSFTTSPPTPLYKTLPQMMHEESIDPQLYMEWTPECEAFAAADHTASPHASAGFGSPAVKEEMDLEGDEMFPPLDTHA